MDEYQLIKGIQQGDHESFKILVETYQRMIVNVCIGIVHNKHDAEDLAQDIFLEIYRNAQSFRGDCKLSTWLYRIATNRSLNFIRNNKRKRFFKTIEEVFSGGQSTSTEISEIGNDQPDHNIIVKQLSNTLHQAIDHLPEKQRIAFVLNKYEELHYQEIADVMEISLSSVETLIHRAKKNLQKTLSSQFKKN